MPYSYGFIGGGNMATALLAGLLKNKVCSPGDILVSDVSATRLDFLSKEYGVTTTKENARVAKESGCIVLAVKPQILVDVADEIVDLIPPDVTVVSILAGVKTSILRARLGGHEHIVRVMPNLPATVGKGTAGIAETEDTQEEDLVAAEKLLGTVGETVRVEEDLMDAVTAISGSGPGYIFRIAEILIRAGTELDLSEEQASRLVVQTIAGAAEMLVQSDQKPGELCRRVCSPGGTTLAGLGVMDDAGLADALTKGVRAARDRSVELSSG